MDLAHFILSDFLISFILKNIFLRMNRISSLKCMLAFCLLMAAAATQVSAQCYGASQSVNELGIRLANISNASSDGGYYVASKATNFGALNGLHYKRYGNYGAFRTSLGLTRYDYQDRRGCPDCIRVDGKVNGIKLRVGYEWFLMMGPIEPFFGLDAVMAYGTYKGETYSTSGNTYRETTDFRTRRGMGISPVAGLRLWLGYAISLSAETSLDAMFFGRTTLISQISPEANTISRANNYFQSTWQPVNWLSLNVMF